MTKCALVANTDWYLYNYRLSLANYLREHGFKVVFISPGGEYVPRLQADGFVWFEWGLERQSLVPWEELASIRQLTGLYREIRPDIVHHHTIKPVLYGGISARQAGLPAVVASITGRGYVFEGKGIRAGTLRQVIKPFYRSVLRNGNTQVVFENEADRQFFLREKLTNPGQTYLVESVGVDPERFIPLPEPDGVPVILLASRLLWDKGVGILVEAARMLQAKGLNFKIVLVGKPDKGNPSSIPETQLKRWESEGIDWWGWQADMQSIYARCHIVVLPSFHEGVPIGLLEAGACQRPVVASDIPGCRAVVTDGENGFLVPPGEPGQLALALERLIVDPELRERMGEDGRKRVLERFTHQVINQQTMEVYRQALS